MKMVPLLLGILLLHCFAPTSASETEVSIRCDLRVELLSLVFRLAGSPGYTKGLIPEYEGDIVSHFSKFRDHPAVKLAGEFAAKNSVCLDAVASMAVHLDDTENVQLIVPIEKASGLDGRWPRRELPEFLTQLRDFAQQSGFNAFCREHEPLYHHYEKRMAATIADAHIVPWLERNFGRSLDVELIVIPALQNGHCNYGAGNNYGDRDIKYAIVGMTSGFLQGRNAHDTVAVVVHEFMHSFVNGMVDRHYRELVASAKRLYSPLENRMRNQGYATAKTMMYEVFVRTATAIYILDEYGEKEARAFISQEKERGFYSVGALVERMISDRSAAGDAWCFEQSMSASAEILVNFRLTPEQRNASSKSATLQIALIVGAFVLFFSGVFRVWKYKISKKADAKK